MVRLATNEKGASTRKRPLGKRLGVSERCGLLSDRNVVESKTPTRERHVYRNGCRLQNDSVL